MYVDRHSIELLLKYSAADATPDETELRQWLSVLVDRASSDARETFTAAVANGDYPFNAVKPHKVPQGEVSLAVDQAPPALLLILGEAVDPDTLDPRNTVPKDLEAPMKVALATWDRATIEQMLDPEGWSLPANEPPQDQNQPPQEPGPDDQVIDQGDDTPIEPDIIDDLPVEEPVEAEKTSRLKLLVAVGGVFAVGLGVWMWRRRSGGQ